MDRERYAKWSRWKSDGTLGRVLYHHLKKHLAAPGRAQDYSMSMESRGLVCFDWMDGVTITTVKNEFDTQQEEAKCIMRACRGTIHEMQTKLETDTNLSDATVMAAHVDVEHEAQAFLQSLETEARHRPKGKEGAQSQETRPAKAELHTLANSKSTLTTALKAKKKDRRSKPRSLGKIDSKLWAGAVDTAQERLKERFGIKDIHAHYDKMCELGQYLLADKIQAEAQGLYDYRAGKQIYRKNRRSTS